MPSYTFGNISVINPCAFDQFDANVNRLGVWFRHLAEEKTNNGGAISRSLV